MQKFILAVSPDAVLLLQLQAHLQEGGRFSVVCVKTGREALSALENQAFNLAILDGEINDLSFIVLTHEMVAHAPNLKLLVFPPQNNPKHPAMSGLLASGFLNKPFFGPEVSEKIAQALNEYNLPYPQLHTDDGDVAGAWIRNPEFGAKQIEQILAATTASAGLLMLRGQVLAGSGTLSPEADANIVNYLNRYWTNIQSGELFRYLSMEHEVSNFIVYAVPLIKDTAIALIYPAEKSLSEIRSEVTRLRKAFLERYSTTRELRMDFGEQAEADSASSSMPLSPASTPKRMTTQSFSEPYSFDETSGLEEPETGNPGLSDKELENLDQILAEMPPPDPGQEPMAGEIPPAGPREWINAEEIAQPAAPLSPLADGISEQPADGLSSVPPEKTAPLPADSSQNNGQPESLPNFDFKLPWEEPQGNVEEQPTHHATPPPPLPAMEQSAAVPLTSSPWMSPQPVQESTGLLPFTFVLFPAAADQFLVQDLARLCNQSLPRILNYFGWQLNTLSIRPLYLQWSALVPPCSLSEKLSDLRLQLNAQIFSSFPALLQRNPSGDFWLPGYFVLSGPKPPSNRMIVDFMALLRQAKPHFQSS